jgi:beta-glucanase (GH16 family)
MLWNDEFSGTALDTSVWSFQIGDGCDIGADLCGWGNAELQWYRAENAVVSDGTLKIIAKEEDFNNYKFTSARIRTLNNLDIDMTQAHLRIEARIKVPDGGDGLWPAFWMLPSDISALEWPTGGEIDIMEFIGREPSHTHGYLHYGNAFDDRVVKGGHLYNPTPPSEVFHEYAIEKKPGEISFYFDGYKYQTFTDGR